MNCNRCGKEIEPGAAFCSGCGNAVNSGLPVNQNTGEPVRQIFTWLVPSILATLFCCIPLGIVSIVFACKANSALTYGNLDEAKANSDKARLFCLLSIGIGFVVSCIVIILQVIAAVLADA